MAQDDYPAPSIAHGGVPGGHDATGGGTGQTLAEAFLRRYGGRRCGDMGAPPSLFGMGGTDEETGEAGGEGVEAPTVLLDYEVARSQWSARPLSPVPSAREEQPFEALLPVRYVDGKDVGRTAAWLETPQGFPLPVRVGQIGAVALRVAPDPLWPGGPPRLECEQRVVERVVALEANYFPWDEIEGVAAALHANGFRFLIPSKRSANTGAFDFAALHNIVNKRTTEEMFRLEGRVARGSGSVEPGAPYPTEPTVLDGRLEDKIGPGVATSLPFGFTVDAPVFGVIKKHATLDYLHPEGGRVFFNLKAGERTPAFVLMRKRLAVVTWYVRTDAADRTAPNEGVLRVEVSQHFFEQVVGGDFGFLDSLSRHLIRCRTRDATYGRAAVTLQPIQRAEELLAARFLELDRIVGDFYRLVRL